MSFDFSSNTVDDYDFGIETPKPRLCVFGVGGAGGNVINRMIESGIDNVEYVALNTDVMDLKKSIAKKRIIMGKSVTRGLGAGMDPVMAQKAAVEAKDEIQEELKHVEMLFIAAGMGGGTGTGATPMIAQWALENHILTVAVVTTPFDFEQKKRMNLAHDGIEELKKHVDTIMIIPNEKLFLLEQNKGKKLTLKNAFALADDILKNAISGLTDMINEIGDINLDFADVKKVMHRKGKAIIGVGHATGDHRGREAAEMAISSPLLKTDYNNNATGVIINIIADPEFTLEQAKEACLVIEDKSGEADVIWGISHDDTLKDEVHVTIIITGFDNYHESSGNKKTLSIRDSFKLYNGHENTKISELKNNVPKYEREEHLQPKTLQSENIKINHTQTETMQHPTNDSPERKNSSSVANTYRLEEEDMKEIEDKPHIPEHFAKSNAGNIDVPAFIRLKSED